MTDRDEQAWVDGILINRKLIVQLFERRTYMKAAGRKRMDVDKRNKEQGETNWRLSALRVALRIYTEKKRFLLNQKNIS